MTPPPKVGPSSAPSSLSFETEDFVLPLPSSLGKSKTLFNFSLIDNQLLAPNLVWKTNLIWMPPLQLKQPILAQTGGNPPPNPVSSGAGPVKSTPPPASPTATATDDMLLSENAWKITRDIFLLIESMDASAQRMIANGGQGTCRYPEFLQASKLKTEGNSCSVIFNPDTHASVDLKIRKTRGKNESRITDFRLSYDPEPYKDEFPANMVWIGGFEFGPRPKGETPFYEEADPPSSKGFALQYFTTGLFSAFASGSSALDFTKDYLASWGLDKAAYFKEAHTDPWRVPQSVPDFVQILKYMKADVPDWINVNKLHKRPKLFQWDSFEKIDITAHLREGQLDLPGLGTLNFVRNKSARILGPMSEKLGKMEKGDEFYKLRDEYLKLLEQTAKLEVHGDTKKLTVSLINPELSSAQFSYGSLKIELKGVTIENASVDLPPLKDLFDRINKGTLNPVFHLKGIGAEKIVLTDEKTGTSTTITNGKIGAIDILSPQNIKISGVSGEKLEMKQPGGLELNVKGPQIASATLKRDGDKTQLGITSLGGDEVSFGFGGVQLNTGKSVLTGLNLADAPGSTQLKIEGIQSTGSVEYKTPDGSFSLSTKGNSQLSGIELNRTQDASGENKVTGRIGLAGTIEKLNVSQNGTFSTQLSNTTLSNGELKIEGTLSAGPNPQLKGFKYGFTSNIDQATIDQAKVGFVELEPSKLKNGTLSIQNDSGDIRQIPKMDISGTLDVHLKQMVGKNESFNLPGFSASGTIKGISISGDAHFVWDQGEWTLERTVKDKAIPLEVKAQVENAEIIQDPHLIPGTDLNKWPSNQVVKSKMKITKATVRLGDVERIEFSLKDDGTKRTSGLKRVLVHDIAIENIEADGVLWAKLPLFYYLRLHGPKSPIKIGTIGSGSDLKPSFIKLGDFEMSIDDKKPSTTLKNLNAEIYEVGGNDQYAKLKVPFLKISPFGPKLVDTGGEQINLDMSLKDDARGGSFKFKSVPRPLDDRNSRVDPAPKGP